MGSWWWAWHLSGSGRGRRSQIATVYPGTQNLDNLDKKSHQIFIGEFSFWIFSASQQWNPKKLTMWTFCLWNIFSRSNFSQQQKKEKLQHISNDFNKAKTMKKINIHNVMKETINRIKKKKKKVLSMVRKHIIDGAVFRLFLCHQPVLKAVEQLKLL